VVTLREVRDDDIDTFFLHMQDAQAVRMAAFTSKDPSDRTAFDARWQRLRANPTIVLKTILAEGRVAGSIMKYEEEGQPEVTYWIGRDFWGQGIATRALQEFLAHVTVRPMKARAAKDNVGSLRVLEKCGFARVREERGFANARGAEIDEVVLVLAR
jgi:RimJ/RimL family protein N-acetyltransferase